MTTDFAVKKHNPEDEDVKYVKSLDGLALFVGFQSDAFSLPVAEFPELKSNSIYFTDGAVDGLIEDYPTGGHDIGIFNYENKTVSPCYYPCDIKKMKKTFPAPMWFFPTRA
ncbi:Putative F-box protein [Striga hermonthica]|uniref:F-box protein n=1 Tax=Striga hermonthica TaxID=68872 RepID=A0A9N7MX66_STRHE|nr:Putative F-box protein [Striga hermonthica]